MGGDNILGFPVPRTSTNRRITEITTLSEDISDLLHSELGDLDLGELSSIIERASGKLYEMGALMVDDGEKERLAIKFLSILKLVAEARKRLVEVSRQEGR